MNVETPPNVMVVTIFNIILTKFKDANPSITDRFAENVRLFTNKHLHLVACIFPTIYYVSLMLHFKWQGNL